MKHTPRFGTLAAVLILALFAMATAAEDLPSPQDLMAKYIEAVGGKKLIKSATSVQGTGTMEIAAMGMTASIDIKAKAPNKFLLVTDMPGMGTITQGFDGETAWQDNPMTGAMILEGELLKQMVQQADFHRDLKYDELYPTQETVEKTEFAGEAAYKVKFVDPDGKEQIEYFSVESGLRIGTEAEQVSDMGTAYVTTELFDYKDFGGWKQATRTVAKMMGMEIMMTIENMELNGVDDSVFALPDNIKTLLESQ